ncbi:hypothetical protein D3C85_1312480 [compost metagenome]
MRAATEDDAATCVNDRALGRQEHFRSLADLPRVAPNRRAVGAQLDLFRVNVFELFGRIGHILGDIDHDRARTAGLCQVERFLHDLRDFRGVLDHEAVLNDRPGNTDHVGFLEGIGTDHGAWHLTGNDDHRDGVHVGRGDTGNGVRGAWTGSHQHHAGLAGGTGIAVSHMGCCLFVTNQNVSHFRFFEQCIVHMQQSTTWVPIDVLDAFVTQKADEHLTAR